MNPKILLIYTGGTIGMVKDSEGVLKPFNFENLLKEIPQLGKVEARIDTLSVEVPKDSAEMQVEDWQNIGELIFSNYNNYSGFVVLHGTDTMAYTTSALSFMFKNLQKPVIFTGSQLPIGDIRTDALENVLTALEIASLQTKGVPKIREVVLYFGNKLFRGNCVSKISSEDFQAFDSPNIAPLATSNVNLQIHNSSAVAKTGKDFKFQKEMVSDVVVYWLHPGIKQSDFEMFCKTQNFKVLILQSYGSGTIAALDWFLRQLKLIIESGRNVINTTQCFSGGVDNMYSSSAVLEKLGILSAKKMTIEAVITKSMFLLAHSNANEPFKSLWNENLRGELG